MDKSGSLSGIFGQLKDPSKKGEAMNLFSVNSQGQSNISGATQRTSSPFFQSQSNPALLNKTGQTGGKQESSAQNPNTQVQNSLSKFTSLTKNNEEKADTRSDVTEKKGEASSSALKGGSQGSDPRGNLAKKSGKSPNEGNTGQQSGIFPPGSFQPSSSSDTFNARQLMNLFSKKDNGSDKDLVIPCLVKNNENLNQGSGATPFGAALGSNKTGSSPFVNFQPQSSINSVLNPLKTGVTPPENTSKSGNHFQQAPNQPSLQQNQASFQNIFQNQPPTSTAQSQAANPFQTSSSQPPSAQLSQNIPSNQLPPFQPQQASIINAEQYHHKHKMLHIPNNEHEESMFQQLQADFDVGNLTVEHFIHSSFNVITDIFGDLKYLAKRPEKLLVEFEQNQKIQSDVEQLSHILRCYPNEILLQISEIEKRQKEMEYLVQAFQTNLTQPIQQHSLSFQLQEMANIQEGVIDYQLEQTGNQSNDLVEIYNHLTCVEGELALLEKQVDNYLSRIPSIE